MASMNNAQMSYAAAQAQGIKQPHARDL